MATEKPIADGAAQEAFEQGVASFHAGDPSAAHASFERAHRRMPRDPRYMSWYGLTLVLVERNSNLGVLLCDQALRAAGPDRDLLLNQARIHLALNQRERTVKAVQRGLDLWPEDPALLRAREALGWRRRPVVPFLSRNNPLNRWFGRIRHGLGKRAGGSFQCTPFNLGVVEPPPQEPRNP
jgi:Flp pilus assembly protein TadD